MSKNTKSGPVSNGKHTLRKQYLIKTWRRKEEAEKRNAERQKYTAMQRYALLDSRLGKGVGARKERDRLLRQAVREREFKLAQSRRRGIDTPGHHIDTPGRDDRL